MTMIAGLASPSLLWRVLLTLSLGASALVPSAALAAEPTPRVRAAARELAVQGVEAYEAADYRTALERFDRAAGLYPAPTVTVMQARSLEKLGRWVEALDRYAITISMSPPPDAPEAFRKAILDAKEESQALRERTPTLEIRVAGPVDAQGSETNLEIKLDGQLVPPALWNVEQLVDPGSHTVSFSGGSAGGFQRVVRLAPGEHGSVEQPNPKRALKAPERFALTAPSQPLRPTGAPPNGSTAARKWAYVSLGAGALGSAVFAVSGGLALSQRSQLQDVCRPGCPDSASDDLSTFRSMRSIATASALVGVAGLGLGTYLFFTGKPGREQQVALSISPGLQMSSATLKSTF